MKRCSQPAAMSELEVDRNYKNVYRQKPKANTKYALQYRQNAEPYNVIKQNYILQYSTKM
jgi:hypothetical protein